MTAGTFLMSSYGTHGDVLPFLTLGRALRKRGHEVVLFTHDHYGAAARAAGLTFVPVDTEETYTQTLRNARTMLLDVLSDINHLADFHRTNGMWDQIRQEYESMAAIVRQRDPSRVVALSRHTSGLSVLMLREALGVPAAWVSPAPIFIMAMPLTKQIYPGTIGDPMNEVRAQVGLPPVDDWSRWLSSVDLELGLWPDWFDEAGTPAPAGTALPGFLPHDETEYGALPDDIAALIADDVPAHRRPVLVTGGSGQFLHREWYQVAIDACMRNHRPAIVACRHRELLPDPLPEDVYWKPSLPFGTLMPEVAAVVHHGGILTCVRAIVSGTPQVLLAHGTDRPDNGARLRHLGLAEWLPAARWTSEATTELLANALTNPGHAARSREYAARIDPDAAAATAADQLEALLGACVDDPDTPLSAAAIPALASTGPPAADPMPVRTRVDDLSLDRRRALAALLRSKRHGG